MIVNNIVLIHTILSKLHRIDGEINIEPTYINRFKQPHLVKTTIITINIVIQTTATSKRKHFGHPFSRSTLPTDVLIGLNVNECWFNRNDDVGIADAGFCQSNLHHIYVKVIPRAMLTIYIDIKQYCFVV